MRSIGSCFVVLLVLAVGTLGHGPAAPLTAETLGAYRVQARVSGLEFTSAQGASLELGRARLCAPSAVMQSSGVAPRRDGERIRYAEDGWSEEYWLRSDGVEQVFVIDRPLREEITIRFPVRSEYRPVALDARTVAFADAGGRNQLLYKDALVMDAGGHVRDLAVTVEGRELAIHVPKDYMDAAVFPVVVDPLVGTFLTLSPGGKLWRTPGVSIAWNSKDQVYLSVWHENVVFDDPPNNHGHLAHNWISGSLVRGRAIKVDAGGIINLGDPISATKPFEGIDIGPAATAGAAGPFVAVGPRATYNPSTNQFFVVWSEGKWEVNETPSVDSDGDGLNGTDPDLNSIFGDTVTDLDDDVSNTNTPNVNEFAYSLDPFPPNTRVVGRPVTIDPSTLTASVGAPVEISMGVGGVPGNPNGPPGGVQDPTAVHPALHPEVSWDGLQYVVVWQTLEVPTIGKIESLPGNNTQYRHIFYTQSRVRIRRLAPTLTVLGNPIDLANQSERFFLKGDVSADGNILDGSVAANLQYELTYNSVPTDPAPHVASIILPGPDEKMGTGDDFAVGSLVVWNVTSLTFNLSKSRVRGRFLPAGSPSAGIVWDIFSPPVQIVQRVSVAAGTANGAGEAALANCHFLVAFQLVENIVRVGGRATEMVGSLALRLTNVNGEPMGAAINIVNSDAGKNKYYLTPTATWCREAEQYLLAWTETDQLWNPVTHGIAFSPYEMRFKDARLPLFGTIATAYPSLATASYSDAIPQAEPTLANHHVMFAAQEDDFGANYVHRYKFSIPAKPLPGVVSGSGGGGGGDNKVCGMGQAAVGAGVGPFAALAGALLLALFPVLGRALRPRSRR